MIIDKPDINFDMSLFDWFKPLDRAIGVVDELVEDKDKANELKSQLRMAELQLRGMAEDNYKMALQTKTIPWVDALHKMGRQIGSFTQIILGFIVLIYMTHKSMEITLEVAAAILGTGGPMAVYNHVKGKGRDTSL